MQSKIPPIKPVPRIHDESAHRSQPLKRALRTQVFANSPAVSVGPAQRREIPATLLKLEPRPLSAYDDNPVFDERSAALFVGVSADCLKKWRQRKQGPDYIQYGPNGAVRYELNALQNFRDRHTVRNEN